MNPLIDVRSLSIIFPLFDATSRSVKARLSQRGKDYSRNKSYIALDRINLQIHAGDRVGLLGKNGAGKTTLLSAFAGIYAPSEGELKVRGEVKTLFGIGVGSNELASGYDNIPLLMVVNGIPLSRLEDVTRDVESFSRLGEALGRPIRSYSTGMKLRIAFAVATYGQAEIILLDEIMGVGDQQFQKSSSDRIDGIIKRSGTLVLASHSEMALRTYCNRGIVLSNGKIVFDGDIEEAIGINRDILGGGDGKSVRPTA